MGLKDVFLVGFFLSVGTAGDITLPALLVALLLAVAVIIKVILYFVVTIRFRLRARTSFFTSLNLANYSEFGLIVGAIALENGWLGGDWLVIMALALTMTCIVAAPLNVRSRKIYTAVQTFARRFENPIPLPEDAPIDPGDARIAIIGMERLGTGAYETLKKKYGDVLFGVSSDPSMVERHQKAGRNVILADATDDEFWFKAQKGQVSVVLLAMKQYEENLGIARRLHEGPEEETGYIFTVADHPEQVEKFKALGVNAVWDFDIEAGTGFAEEVISQLGDDLAMDNL